MLDMVMFGFQKIPRKAKKNVKKNSLLMFNFIVENIKKNQI